jgi:Trp operon repressor
MSNKLIKDMDEETWRRFIAFCKLKNIKANDQLKEILEEFLNKNLGKFINTRGGRAK